MPALRLFFLCLIIAFLQPLAARGELAASAPTYVAPATLPPGLLPPPPAEGSPEWQEELATIVANQRTSPGLDELSDMRAEQHVRIELLTDLLGPRFTPGALPKTFALLDRVLADAVLVTDADKKYWNTRRPYAADQRVKLLTDPPDDARSYPSGHASETRVLAEVLGLLLPQRRDDMRARAKDIARRQVDAGAHYSFDIEGGRMLAMLITGALMRSEPFRQDLMAAHEELMQAGFRNP